MELRDADGTSHHVRICSKDHKEGGPSPIAVTQEHALFLINGGYGYTRTNEEVGLAVLALGKVMSRNESNIGRVATETIREHGLTRAV